jgi:hypothetical protein
VHLHQFFAAHPLCVEAHSGAIFAIAAETVTSLVVLERVALDTGKFAFCVDRLGEELVTSNVITSQRFPNALKNITT